MIIKHPFEPIYDENSKILILGSFPSVKSREFGYCYAHPQNRFWKIIAKVFNDNKIPETIEAKKNLLLKNNIAVWDILSSCNIEGSADNNIKEPKVNDIYSFVSKTNITKIFFNGKVAFDMYNRYCTNKEKLISEVLPSTSPANATYGFEKLCNIWEAQIMSSLN